MEVRFENPVAVSDVRNLIETHGYVATVQKSDENGVLIRTKTLSETEHNSLRQALESEFGGVDELRFDSIGPVIGSELRRNAILGVIVTLVLIALYVAWAFRKVSKPVASWKYGLLTIVAAFHDVIITLGAFSVLGHFFGWEIGTAFVAAVLTILGYSINDTVVVFDRTRENLALSGTYDFESTVEKSVNQTLARSLATSISTLLALFAIFLFGGATTQPFALALIIGIAVGTYSSLFLASPLLVAWETRKR